MPKSGDVAQGAGHGSAFGSGAKLAAATRAGAEAKGQDLQQAIDIFQKGTELAHSASSYDDYLRAIEALSVAIAIRSDQPRFFFARGNAFRAINEFACAARDYSAAIAMDDRAAGYFANRGACYRKLHQPARALEDLTSAIEVDGKKGSHLFNRAMVLYEYGFFREALLDFSRTLEDGSAGLRIEYRALQHRGHCHRKLGNLAKCIDDLKHAIQLDTHNAAGFSSLAQAYVDSGDLDHAIEHFTNAIQFNATQAASFSQRGLCYYRQSGGDSRGGGQPQMARLALADFNQAIRLDGTDPHAYFYRGSIRLSLALELLQVSSSSSAAAVAASSHSTPSSDTADDPDKSLDRRNSSGSGGIATAPTPSVSTTSPALTAEEQLNAASADIEMAWTLAPRGLTFQLGVAMVTQLRQQYQDAANLLHEIYSASFSSSSSHAAPPLSHERALVVVNYHWALCAHMIHDTETALTLLCDCVDIVPDEPLFCEARGLLLQETGHHELAIPDFTHAMELRARQRDELGSSRGMEPPWNLYLRAESQLRLDRFQEAVADCSAALAASSEAQTNPTLVVPAHRVLQQQLQSSIRNTRAMAYRGLCEFEEAIQDLSVCLTLTPTNDIFHFHRARCLMACERYGDALPDLHAAVAAPGNATDHFQLYCIGLCYFHKQQTDECIEFLQRALQHKPAPELLPDIHYRIGLSHAREHRQIKAIEHFTFALDFAKMLQKPAENHALSRHMLMYVHERAKALQLEHYYDDAIVDFSLVLRHNPHNAHAFFRRGFAYKSLGMLREAAADFESAKLLDPKNPKLLINYKQLRDTDCIILCTPGDETDF